MSFHPDGAEQRIFRPLWWRTFRYVDVQIETGEEPLVVESFSSEFTAYPFDMNARFDGGDSLFDRLMDVGWRTARLCAHETYMDCPYYEQLQYAGDTRLQILVGYYNSGDTRLGRKAIQQLNLSRNASGLTLSRAPSRLPQYIPGFSLWWIGMLHDYLYFARDGAFVSDSMQGVKNVLAYYESLSKRRRHVETGSLVELRRLDLVEKRKPAPEGKMNVRPCLIYSCCWPINGLMSWRRYQEMSNSPATVRPRLSCSLSRYVSTIG